MKYKLQLVILFFFVTAFASAAAHGQFGGKRHKKRAKVNLVSSVQAVVPGESFNVGLHFQIDEGWHIYWKNGGDAGTPPRATWTLPSGFTIGELQFPVPVLHIDAGTIVSNILEGEPVLLSRVSTPSALKGQTVTIAGKIKYLVCEKACLREEAEVSLELPVVSSGGKVELDNEKLFSRARKALPRDVSKYVSVSPSVTTQSFDAETKFDLVLNMEVAKGYHIQSNTPSNEAFIACEVFVDPFSEIDFSRPVYPKGKVRQDKVLGKLSEYEGKFTVRVPGEVWEKPKDVPIRFGGILKYQACTNTGKCFAPEAVSFSFTVGEKVGSAQSGEALQDDTHLASSDSAVDSGAEETVAAILPAGADESSATGVANSSTPFWKWLFWAFLGGLILNVMPCVLPVISIKVLSLVQQAAEEPRRVVKLGLTYCAGVLASFLALAVTMVVLKDAGEAKGWGFQMQDAGFVVIMVSIVFVFGLSLFGVFTITLPGAAMTKLSAAEEREGYLGTFLKGVLSTILATPCTAPFLGAVVGFAYASTTSSGRLVALLMVVGLGMASPFILLSINPAWLRFMPKPGAWMEHFKQLMGFLLMGTVVFLMFILGHLIGVDGLIRASAFLVILAVAVWILGLQTPLTSAPRRLSAWCAATMLAVAGWMFAFTGTSSIPNLVEDYNTSMACVGDTGSPALTDADWGRGKIPWQRWAEGRAKDLASQGYTVYIDYTAVWCATCITNKKAALETTAVRGKMQENCVVPIKADFTSENPAMFSEITDFDRAGVPLNVIYPAGKPNEPIVMPEILVGRTQFVVDKLIAAGPSETCVHTKTASATMSN